MNYLNFSWADYTLFAVMVGLSAVVGVYYGCFGKQQETRNDYLLGGKKMKVFPVAMSLVASTLSGVTLLAMPAEVYRHGSQYMMLAVSPILVGLAVNFIYLPVYCKFELTSVFEYLDMRFDKNLRIMASILFTLTNIIYLPIVIYAPSLAFNQGNLMRFAAIVGFSFDIPVTGFDLHIIAIVMSSICIFYTTIGGLKAVVWTDTLQFSITLCTLGCVLVMGTISVGGFGTIWEKAKLGDRIEFFNMNPDPTERNTFWSVVVGCFITWTAWVAVTPATSQRFLAVPTWKDSKKVLIIFTIFALVTKTVCSFSGLIMYAKYHDCDPLSAGYMERPDQIVPYYVLDVANQIPGFSGLFVSGLFSTALSTLSTYLNSLSGIIYTDFVSPFMDVNISEKKASTIMKFITAIIGLTSVALIFLVERLGTILQAAVTFNGITLGPLLGLFTMGMLFPSANKKGALWGSIGSLLFMAFIGVKNQIHVWKGNIKHPTRPLYTHGCNSTISAETFTSTMIPPEPEEVFWLFKISFHYYVLMGAVITLVIGLLVSWFTRNSNDFLVNTDLLSPCIHRFLAKSARTTRYESGERERQVLKKEANRNGTEMTEPSAQKLLLDK